MRDSYHLVDNEFALILPQYVAVKNRVFVYLRVKLIARAAKYLKNNALEILLTIAEMISPAIYAFFFLLYPFPNLFFHYSVNFNMLGKVISLQCEHLLPLDCPTGKIV